MQFSRGCPHQCNYCGQRGFWARWRHRDPKKFAEEIAWLHREHGVELFNLADENPTVNKAAWRLLRGADRREHAGITIIGSTRADDIVRDADILHLYRKAGIERFLLGIENTDEATLQQIRQGRRRPRPIARRSALLRQHGILSLATWVADFEDVTRSGSLPRRCGSCSRTTRTRSRRCYVTPHRWTGYFRQAAERRVIQLDQRRWDYKHQVLATRHMPPWRVIAVGQADRGARAGAAARALAHVLPAATAPLRHGMRWYTRMGRRVWFHEMRNFFFRDRRVTNGPTLRAVLGRPAGPPRSAGAHSARARSAQ